MLHNHFRVVRLSQEENIKTGVFNMLWKGMPRGMDDNKKYSDSGIDLGQGINVGPGKFGKKNKRRALNIHVLSSKKPSK